jgi:hypothetical protein
MLEDGEHRRSLGPRRSSFEQAKRAIGQRQRWRSGSRSSQRQGSARDARQANQKRERAQPDRDSERQPVAPSGEQAKRVGVDGRAREVSSTPLASRRDHRCCCPARSHQRARRRRPLLGCRRVQRRCSMPKQRGRRHRGLVRRVAERASIAAGGVSTSAVRAARSCRTRRRSPHQPRDR